MTPYSKAPIIVTAATANEVNSTAALISAMLKVLPSRTCNFKLSCGRSFKNQLNMEKRAAGIVIFRKISTEFEFLLLQASYGTHHWTPPKGHVDPGESDIETALRETKEEAGFDKEDLKIVDGFQKTLKYLVNGTPKTVIYWLAELYKNKPVLLSSEHQDFKWGNLDEAIKLSEYEDLQKLLRECESYLLSNYGK